MKQDIEKLFQDALSNAEVPYQAGAWEAMSAKLDPKKAPFSKGKWYLSAAAVAVIGGIVALISSKESNGNAKQASHTERQVSSTQIAQQHSTGAATTVQSAANLPSTSSEAKNESDVHSGQPASAQPQSVLPDRNPNPEQPLTVDVERTNPLPKETERKTPNNPGASKLFAPVLPASICTGESFVISNPNNSELWIKLPGENVRGLKGNQKITVSADQSGEIVVNNGETTQKVLVNAAASAEIVGSDQILYDNGIPQLTFTTSAKLDNVSWSSNAPGADSRDGYAVFPYHNDQVTVLLKGIDQNGCKVSETRKIDLTEKYNLLAPEAFRPEGSIAANQFFMPFALIQRETPFELMIFDVKNGFQIFATKDASKGWDGHDSRNGELVPVGSIWVWKVILKSPRPGENPVYSGTITRL